MNKYLYWITTIILTIIYIITGIGNLVPFEHIANDISRLGYPPYFMKFLGVWKIIGALALILPVPRSLKLCAYAGLVIDLTGAIYSRYAMNDSAMSMIVPSLIFCIVVVSLLTMRK